MSNGGKDLVLVHYEQGDHEWAWEVRHERTVSCISGRTAVTIMWLCWLGVGSWTARWTKGLACYTGVWGSEWRATQSGLVGKEGEGLDWPGVPGSVLLSGHARVPFSIPPCCSGINCPHLMFPRPWEKERLVSQWNGVRMVVEWVREFCAYSTHVRNRSVVLGCSRSARSDPAPGLPFQPGLGVVSGYEADTDPQILRKCLPHTGGKLCRSIRYCTLW